MEDDLVNSGIYTNFFNVLWVSDENINPDKAAREGSYLNSTGLHNLYQTLFNDDLTPAEIDAMITEVNPSEAGKIYVDDFIIIMERAKDHNTSLKWHKVQQYIENHEFEQREKMLETSAPTQKRRMRFGGRRKSRKTAKKQRKSKKRRSSRKQRKQRK
jgi:hypothetical protein